MRFDFQADGVAVLNEINFVHAGESVGDGVRQLIDLFVADSHNTALYLRTSSFFTFLNIS